MTSFRRLIDRRGVALFIVLASMATLAIFVSEITYTAQINQKLAYDKLDQVKAQALAKSGLRLALLRIRAYSELKKTVGQMAQQAGASQDMVNSLVPKAMIEKIWSEPVTIPFSGDISGLPGEIKDALGKFRKDSNMEGKLYINIQAQSNKINLNSTLPGFAVQATPTPAKKGSNQNSGGTPGQDQTQDQGQNQNASASPTPISYDPEQARQSLQKQIEDTFQKKSEEDERFRDQYRSFRVEDLVQEILGWSDLAYDSPREQVSTLPFKRAPFYHISELHYLPSMDDTLYDVLADQFNISVASYININTIKEPVLKALIPQMTAEEIKKFFEFRDGKGESGNDDNTFKDSKGFYEYLKGKVQFFSGSETRISDLQKALAQRGIQLTTDESNFLVHIEATVQQTKKTLEAMVSIVEKKTASVPNDQSSQQNPQQNSRQNPQKDASQNPASGAGEKSNLKITQLRFL
ncbi:MAG: hypothetical protein EBX52_02660 [Proteobacteria bacterium]|nr:hypothetical protein [Pseudomonadota bacterium]